MKANLIGVGYWGSFIYKTLKEIGFTQIELCDPEVPGAHNNYKKMDEAPFIFIATPVSSHYEICKYFLSRGKRVFCEKPLVTTEKEAIELYDIAKKHNTYLFVDWVFTYNYGVELIKQHIEDKKNNDSTKKVITHISMRRRNTKIDHIIDVNAKLDLAVHDVSILLSLTQQLPLAAKWHEYKKNSESVKFDSALGYLTFGEFEATIDVSWYNAYKDRECIIKFNDDEYIIWNDTKQTIEVQKNFRDYPVIINYGQHASPLERSIKQFLMFNDTTQHQQKELTLNILRVVENDNKI